MIILIAGATHTGKTAYARQLPCICIDEVYSLQGVLTARCDALRRFDDEIVG